MTDAEFGDSKSSGSGTRSKSEMRRRWKPGFPMPRLHRAYRLETAHHEASHVVVAYALDMECHGTELFGEDGGGRSTIPPTVMFSNDGDPSKPIEFLGYKPEKAVVSYAGRVGHTKFLREYTGRPKARPGENHFSSDVVQFSKVVKDDEKLARWAKREAVRLVHENWDLIKVVALELYRKGSLNRWQIEKLIPRLMKAKAARLKERLAADWAVTYLAASPYRPSRSQFWHARQHALKQL
jgi:hypothetical protein